MNRTWPSGSRANTPDRRSQKPSSGTGMSAVKHVGQPARVKVDPEHGGAANDRAVARVESVDARHRRGADALGELIAATGRGRREQVLEELGAASGSLDRELEHVRRHLRRFRGGIGERQGVLARERAELDPDAGVAET